MYTVWIPCFPKRLFLASFVSFRVQCCLKCGVPSCTRHYFSSQLNKGSKVKSNNSLYVHYLQTIHNFRKICLKLFSLQYTFENKDIKLWSSYFWLVEANFPKHYTSSVYNNVELLHLILRCHFVGEKSGIAKCWLLSQAIVKFDQRTCKRKSVWK